MALFGNATVLLNFVSKFADIRRRKKALFDFLNK